jgi:hypothetical protein
MMQLAQNVWQLGKGRAITKQQRVLITTGFAEAGIDLNADRKATKPSLVDNGKHQPLLVMLYFCRIVDLHLGEYTASVPKLRKGKFDSRTMSRELLQPSR